MTESTHKMEARAGAAAILEPAESAELLAAVDDDVEDDEFDDEFEGRLERDDPPPHKSERPLRTSSMRRLRRQSARDRRPAELRRGALVAGKYRAGALVHQSEVAVTIRAVHRELGQNVTISALSSESARRPGLASEFLNHARLASRLDSEHAARVLDVGILESGAPFSVAEALDGWTLNEVVCVRGPLPVQEAIHYVIQAADAVAAAHSVGIVHRCLGPNSIVLSQRSDGSPRIKVGGFDSPAPVPFGWFDDNREHGPGPAEFMAVLPFLAPEQIRDRDVVDFRTDVWALGAILQMLLTGAPPFRAPSKAALLAAIVADSPLPIGTVRADVAPELEEVILRALEKEPTRRAGSVADFVRGLAPYAAGDALLWVERITKSGVGRLTEPPPLPIPRARAIVPIKRPTATEPRARTRWSAYGFAAAGLVGALAGGFGALAVGGGKTIEKPADPVVQAAPPPANLPSKADAPATPATTSAAVSPKAPVPVLALPRIQQPVHRPAPVSPAEIEETHPVTAAAPVTSPASGPPTSASSASAKDLFDDTR